MGFIIRGKAAPYVGLFIGIAGVALVVVGVFARESMWYYIFGISCVVVTAVIFIDMAVDRIRSRKGR